MASIDIDATGPLFDGRAEGVVREFCEDLRDAVAQYGEETALALMRSYFRRPTGFYWSRVRTTVITPDLARVHDSSVVYGPWLAGTGSRNFPVTRFKGYPHWRQAQEATRTRAPQIAAQMLPRYTSRM